MRKISYWLNNHYYEDQVKLYRHKTIFQVCSDKNIDLPCFCYHENLSIAGNCRMCLVELNVSLKLVVACAMSITQGVKVYTSNNRVKRAREAIIEFLLINHPLDCPICDQGGECDLQDLTLVFGSDKSRYYEPIKRAVMDKECGHFVKMVMTRCIHCTRCVRFMQEVSGVKDFGMLNRGNESEISTYIFKVLNDEICANIIDICPVGALTSKPYAYKARPWELNFLESIDIMDSMCSNVRVDYLNNSVMRILPVYNSNVNEDWITNKARFVYDSLNTQRIYNPSVRIEDEFIPINWDIAITICISQLIKIMSYTKSSIIGISGFFSDLSSIKNMSWFFNKIGGYTHINDFFEINSDVRSNFLMNITILSLESKTSFIFVGFNSRLECPLLNTRLRRCYQRNDTLRFFAFGLVNHYTNLPIINLGNDYYECFDILKGKSLINKLLFNHTQVFNFYVYAANYNFTSVALIFGISASKFFKLHYLFDNFVRKHFLFSRASIVYPFSGFLNYFELNNKTYNNVINLFSNKNFIFLHKVDERLFINLINRYKNNFIIYNGSHFDYGAKQSNICLPALTHFEDNFFYINIEGKLLMTKKVISNNNNIYSVNEIFRLFNIFLRKFMPNNIYMGLITDKILSYFEFLKFDFDILKFYKYETKLYSKYNLVNYNNYNRSIFYLQENNIFSSFIYNYYKTDFFSRNSKTLTLASTNYVNNLNNFGVTFN